MKNKLVLFVLLIGFMGYSQNGKTPWLDVMLSNYEYPYPVDYITINAQQQELKMAYMDVKPEKANGKTIMLLHGKNFNGAYWETTINGLTADGYRVIVPDQIGFGKSSKPDNYQYSFQALAKNTKAILDTLKVTKTAVLGHSMGGMLATRFALMYPETTEKLILENPIGLEDWKLVVPYQTIDQWYAAELQKTAEKIKAYQLKYYYDGKWKSEYDQWVELLAGWTLNSDYPKVAWNAALTYDMIFNQPVLYEFEHITCPTLLIIGTRDRTALGKAFVPEEVRQTMGLYNKLGKATQQSIPNSELVEIPNIGHLPHIESFQAFITPLKSFLTK
ncbi:alpha/beta fold hydrolase [Maribacter polysaccharolyticus]|uniref:alpha/beta fold hydrolase n=1 Tax=Maribacter polysaccharolyticus TaxID=3020831 RepID=UPI00237F48C9|nr:alpha/beta hydrolase [Maribacter polysaccharolyticus]MDE3742032.1 alpha/beta hydrolase [Maribacter polysaccharolyticus]